MTMKNSEIKRQPNKPRETMFSFSDEHWLQSPRFQNGLHFPGSLDYQTVP